MRPAPYTRPAVYRSVLLVASGFFAALVVFWLLSSTSTTSVAPTNVARRHGRLLSSSRVSPGVAAQRLADHVEQLGKLHWIRSKIDRDNPDKSVDPNLPGKYGNVMWSWDVAKPTMQCSTLSRIGKFGDGGKWMCDLQWLPEPCVVYAYGVWGDVSWDEDLRAKTGCEMHLFDASSSWCSGKDGKV